MLKINFRKHLSEIHFPSFSLGIIFTLFLLLIMNFSYSDSGLLSVEFPQDYKISSPLIPNELTFAGERIPIEDDDVKEIFEREFIVNTYFHSSTLFSLKRAPRWFPVIQPILAKYNIPDDFKYIVMVESNFTNVVSPKNAVGFWQLLKSSAESFGLEVNDEVDERYHVEKSTEAACKYLLDAYNRFGSWTFAAASYNMGIGGINRQLDKQRETKFFNLLLNEETTRYIGRIVSMKYIYQNPSNYGYKISPDDVYKPIGFKTVVIADSIMSWTNFAKANETNYKTLKKLNPWLRDNKLTNKKKYIYQIKLPD